MSNTRQRNSARFGEFDSLRSGSAFTLIEMLVVIAVIAILAGMLLTIGPAVKNRGKVAVAKAQLKQLENAIESYNAKNGFYPPANANLAGSYSRGWCASNALFYELTGTTYDQAAGAYYDLGNNAVPLIAGVPGFANSEAVGKRGKNFLSGEPKTESLNGFRFLSVPVPWPDDVTGPPLDSLPGKNVWFYDSKSQQRHNVNSYDLWTELMLPTVSGYKKEIISNWKE